MKDQQALPGRARHSVRALWRCSASRATHHVRGGQGTARPTRSRGSMHARIRMGAFHEPGNIQHSTFNVQHPVKVEDRKRPPHPGPLPQGGEGEDEPEAPSGSGVQCAILSGNSLPVWRGEGGT